MRVAAGGFEAGGSALLATDVLPSRSSQLEMPESELSSMYAGSQVLSSP